MKKIIFSILLTFVYTLSINAQVEEGHVIYDIEISSDDPQMEMVIPMMQGSKLEMHFIEGKSRTKISIGSMMTTTIITNIKEDAMLMLMGGMMGNKAIPSSIQELEEENETTVAELDVEFTDETKMIVGFKCKQAILTDEDGNEMTYWYTEEIEIEKQGQSYLNNNVPGFPLEFETQKNGLTMKMIVTEFSEFLDGDEDELFDLSIPEGYDEMTFEELKAGGM